MHRITFFNLESYGDGEKYIETNRKLSAAAIKVDFEKMPLDIDHLPDEKDFDIAGVFADSKIDADVINSLPKLKCIVTLSTGFDHIDLRTCAIRNIIVSSVPNYGENTVAEYAFALILALSRKIYPSVYRVHEENSYANYGLSGFDLFGKTLGVIGTGRIGKQAIRIAKGFGMKVIAFDVIHDKVYSKEIGFSYVSLETLLSSSDIITIHVPHLPETYHLINKNNVGLIKKGSFIINTARGAVIETTALLSALQSGNISGAALDVLEEEAAIKNGDIRVIKDLLEFTNVIITPHNAFNTQEAFKRILDTTIDNALAFVNGKPANLVM